MSWNDHDHRGEYAEVRHDHDGDYAERHHRHYDDESTARGLREDLSRAEEDARELRRELAAAHFRIGQLEEQYNGLIGQLWATGTVPGGRGDLTDALDRIASLEKQTPQARQLQYEADLAMADLAESGYRFDDYGPPIGADRHGSACQCPYCLDDEPEEATR